jgi:hypothetical protein
MLQQSDWHTVAGTLVYSFGLEKEVEEFPFLV